MPKPAEESIVVKEVTDGVLEITCTCCNHTMTYITQAQLTKALARTEIKVTLPKDGSPPSRPGKGGYVWPKPGKISSWIGGVVSLGRKLP